MSQDVIVTRDTVLHCCNTLPADTAWGLVAVNAGKPSMRKEPIITILNLTIRSEQQHDFACFALILQVDEIWI